MKKGAYDLGRKAVYYIVVVVIIAVLFLYITNNFRNYQIIRLSTLDKATDLVMVQAALKCLSQKDTETGRTYMYKIDESKLEKEALINCLGKDKPYNNKAIKIEIKIKDKDKEIITQEPYFEYNEYTRTVDYNGQKEKLKISIEQYPTVK
ncbi:MAG: hypothetical protein Q8N77_06490 [Nanoarchaeota archaeon]|nr:hypothetical protein [Nanoarchaeota archaeon]